MRRFVTCVAALVISYVTSQPAMATRYKRDYRFLGAKGGEEGKRNGKTTMERRAAPAGSPWVAALPFGAGQFQEGSYGLGLSFAALQTGGLYYYYAASRDAELATRQTNDFLVGRRQDGNEPSAEEDRATQQFVADRQKYIEQQRQRAQTGLYLFAGSWLVSSSLALWNLHDGPVSVGLVRTQTGELASGLVGTWRL